MTDYCLSMLGMSSIENLLEANNFVANCVLLLSILQNLCFTFANLWPVSLQVPLLPFVHSSTKQFLRKGSALCSIHVRIRHRIIIMYTCVCCFGKDPNGFCYQSRQINLEAKLRALIRIAA